MILTIYLIGVFIAMVLFGFTTAFGAREDGDDPVEALMEVLDDGAKPLFSALLWPMIVAHFFFLLVFRLKDTANQVPSIDHPPGWKDVRSGSIRSVEDDRRVEEEANRIWKGGNSRG